jgi:hypothetical protein
MTNPALDNEDEKPLDPAVEKVRRKMIRFMGINLSLLFLALMAVVGGIVYKSRTVLPASPETDGLALSVEGLVEGSIGLPAGARITSQSFNGKSLSLLVEEAGGRQVIYVFDIASRRIVGRFEVVAK